VPEFQQQTCITCFGTQSIVAALLRPWFLFRLSQSHAQLVCTKQKFKLCQRNPPRSRRCCNRDEGLQRLAWWLLSSVV